MISIRYHRLHGMQRVLKLESGKSQGFSTQPNPASEEKTTRLSGHFEFLPVSYFQNTCVVSLVRRRAHELVACFISHWNATFVNSLAFQHRTRDPYIAYELATPSQQFSSIQTLQGDELRTVDAKE